MTQYVYKNGGMVVEHPATTTTEECDDLLEFLDYVTGYIRRQRERFTQRQATNNSGVEC